MFGFAISTFVLWAIADLFYKKQASEGKYSHIKTGIIVGFVMGISVLVTMTVSKVELNFAEVLEYLPISACYIISMVIGYKGLQYLNVSLISPIQNSSGVITTIMLFVIFKDELTTLQIVAVAMIGISILLLSLKEGKEEKKETEQEKVTGKVKKITFLAIAYPLLYCFFDGIGTFLDAVYLDKLAIVSEESALVSYQFTFFIFAICSWFYLHMKGEKLNMRKQGYGITAALFETAGQQTYVYAMASDSTLAAAIVGSYCIGSLLLGHLFLHEKLDKIEYLYIAIAIVGIILLG